MRHRKKRGNLGRKTSPRKALLKNLAISLILRQRIETTLAKAKALRVFVEPIITIAKNDMNSLSAKRLVFKKLCCKDTVGILFGKLAPLFKDVNGGYTRIIPLGFRKGDGADTAVIELTKRTISDEDLMGVSKKKEKAPKVKGKEKKAVEKTGAEEEKASGKKDTGTATMTKPVKKEEKHTQRERKGEDKKAAPKAPRKGFFNRFGKKEGGDK
ncbi:MAG: 50S ribosomal protein L17 [Candidatus Omnitrophica bacterium]|nr:50S ribosomal protein L17 [Candidatus Omnitrophota bacterium]